MAYLVVAISKARKGRQKRIKDCIQKPLTVRIDRSASRSGCEADN